MTDTPTKMNSVKATNTFEGVLLLGQDESMLLSVGNTEKLRNDLNECLATAAGYTLREIAADEVEPKMKIVLGLNSYYIRNVLTDRRDYLILQFDDDMGEECELTVPEDFVVSIMERVE